MDSRIKVVTSVRERDPENISTYATTDANPHQRYLDAQDATSRLEGCNGWYLVQTKEDVEAVWDCRTEGKSRGYDYPDYGYPAWIKVIHVGYDPRHDESMYDSECLGINDLNPMLRKLRGD